MDGLSANAERLFTRLIMRADDFGRFHCEPRLVKANCFPLAEDITSADVGPWLSELADRGLIVVYEVEGRKFLAIANYGQRLKDSRAKFPTLPGSDASWLPMFDSFLPLPGIPSAESKGFREVPGSSGKFPPEEKGSRREVEPEPEAERKSNVEAEVESPKPPKGDVGAIPKKDNRPTTPEAKRIADLYHRKHSTPWTSKEIKSYRALFPLDPADLDLVCRYTEAERTKGDDGRHRRDLGTFLNNYVTEVDRANEWLKKPTPKSTLEKETLFDESYEQIS